MENKGPMSSPKVCTGDRRGSSPIKLLLQLRLADSSATTPSPHPHHFTVGLIAVPRPKDGPMGAAMLAAVTQRGWLPTPAPTAPAVLYSTMHAGWDRGYSSCVAGPI